MSLYDWRYPYGYRPDDLNGFSLAKLAGLDGRPGSDPSDDLIAKALEGVDPHSVEVAAGLAQSNPQPHFDWAGPYSGDGEDDAGTTSAQPSPADEEIANNPALKRDLERGHPFAVAYAKGFGDRSANGWSGPDAGTAESRSPFLPRPAMRKPFGSSGSEAVMTFNRIAQDNPSLWRDYLKGRPIAVPYMKAEYGPQVGEVAEAAASSAMTDNGPAPDGVAPAQSTATGAGVPGVPIVPTSSASSGRSGDPAVRQFLDSVDRAFGSSPDDPAVVQRLADYVGSLPIAPGTPPAGRMRLGLIQNERPSIIGGKVPYSFPDPPGETIGDITNRKILELSGRGVQAVKDFGKEFFSNYSPDEGWRQAFAKTIASRTGLNADGVQLAEEALEFIPVLGIVGDVADVGEAAYLVLNGNWQLGLWRLAQLATNKSVEKAIKFSIADYAVRNPGKIPKNAGEILGHAVSDVYEDYEDPLKPKAR